VSRQGASKADYRARALELWDPPPDAGAPLACVATTFTFDATFFETECLGRFLAMDTHPDESQAVAYLVEREEKLAGAQVGVVVDRRHAQSKESLRWDVIPVLVPRSLQHAKVSILCWSNAVRVVVGSGNLTEPGYRRNVEIFGALELEPDEPGPVALILRCLDFVQGLTSEAVGSAGDGGPIDRARSALQTIRGQVRRWKDDPSHRSRVALALQTGDSSALQALVEETTSRRPARTLYVLSPFFDVQSSGETMTAVAAAMMAKTGSRVIIINPLVEDLPDGRRRVHAPRELVDRAMGLTDSVEVSGVPLIQDGETRPLHAKAIWLESDKWIAVMVGSSNFTRAGLGLGGPRNREANLVYFARPDEPLARHLNEIWPELEDEPVDLASDEILWNPVGEEEGESDGAIIPLPACFREALFSTRPKPTLSIRLDDGLPSSWEIAIPGEGTVLSSATTGVGLHSLDRSAQPVPFLVTVRWSTTDGDYVAGWPVNVADLSELPPPDELRNLSLEELIDVIGSTRPLHQALPGVLAKRSRVKNDREQLDPHKRVKTETFLLRRTRRIARALDRLLERLERPAFSLDAFLWRLEGPIGALALARALQKEANSEAEALFFMAELALTLNRVDPKKVACGTLASRDVSIRIRACIDELEGLVEHPGIGQATMIRDYVRDAFAEVRK